MNIPFSEFREIVRKKRLPPQVDETENAYELTLFENGVYWTCVVYKEIDPLYDPQVMADYEAYKLQMRVGESSERRSEDGRLQTQPLMLDTNLWHRFTSFGDDATTIGAGQPALGIVNPGDPNLVVNIEFRDWFQVFGGMMKYEGAEISTDDGDWISFRVVVPNNDAVAPNATMTGNAMVYANVVMPMAGNGPYDVDLTKANIIPAPKSQGFWTWNWPDTGRGSITPASGQTGEFLIITPTYVTAEFIGKSLMLGSGNKTFSPPNPKPTYMFPGWMLQAEIHKISNGTTPLKVIWELQTARRTTT